MTEVWKEIKESVAEIVGRESEDAAIMMRVEEMSVERGVSL